MANAFISDGCSADRIPLGSTGDMRVMNDNARYPNICPLFPHASYDPLHRL